MTVPPYHHGVRVLEVNDGPRPLRPVATSIFGTVCTSSDADADVFPLNTPVLVTDVMAAAGKSGVTGTMAKTLQTIGEQSSPVGVVVRVAAGEDQAETDTNVIGTIAGGQRTGLQALLQAEAVAGVVPRIIALPGLDSPAVAAAMAVILPKLNAFGYATCSGADTIAEANTYRDGFSARELMLIYGEFTGWSGQAAAAALGLRARLDEEVGWHKSISNVPVAGVTGIDRSISWNLQDPSTDAGVLNQAGITTLIRRNGFKFWGSRTCAEDTLFQFETAVRTAQILKDTIAEGCLQFVDKPLHPSLARDIIESINASFRGLKAAGYILGATAWLNEQLNTPDALASGALQIDYDFTPVPPLENLLLRQRITDRYMADFANRVALGR
ncbi:MAG: phage tail sheath subtilisin-like domain-containing protein [Phenylobacterium sp.]|nr:phage tail sheath subtilisin-like domain-containing protein [Phenylobacterium sp.]